MAKVLMIGAGGVGGVVAKKMAQNHAVFAEFMIASRTLSKCDAIKSEIEQFIPTKSVVTTAKVDADNVPELVALIQAYKPDLVLNVAFGRGAIEENFYHR